MSVPNKKISHTMQMAYDKLYTFTLTTGKMYTGLSLVDCIV